MFFDHSESALSDETSLCLAPGFCLNLLEQLFLSYGLTALFGIVVGIMSVCLWRRATAPPLQSRGRDGS